MQISKFEKRSRDLIRLANSMRGTLQIQSKGERLILWLVHRDGERENVLVSEAQEYEELMLKAETFLAQCDSVWPLSTTR